MMKRNCILLIPRRVKCAMLMGPMRTLHTPQGRLTTIYSQVVTHSSTRLTNKVPNQLGGLRNSYRSRPRPRVKASHGGYEPSLVGELQLLFSGQAEQSIETLEQLMLEFQRNAVARKLEEPEVLRGISDLCNDLPLLVRRTGREVAADIDNRQLDIICRRHDEIIVLFSAGDYRGYLGLGSEKKKGGRGRHVVDEKKQTRFRRRGLYMIFFI
ncbi:hypothetical protein F4678DRAFT_99115 [Xylaria arbuscula]|nr:hypothetical protein F4678DRAFT_99115 [Xylaria arbuscula]